MNWLKEKIRYHIFTLQYTSGGSHVGNKYFQFYCTLPETILIWPYKWNQTKWSIRTENPSKTKLFLCILVFLQHILFFGHGVNQFSSIKVYPQSISIFVIHINLLIMDTFAVFLWLNMVTTTTLVDAFDALLRFDSRVTGKILHFRSFQLTN